ncbi:glycosyltransferase [Candidatus Margulisiibacteriota bacterium]
MLKILLINKLYYPWIGGVEVHVQDLAENLGRLTGVSVEVLTCSDKYQYSEEEINGVKVTRLPNIFYRILGKSLLFSMPLALSFPKWLKKSKADILHFHLPNPLAVISYFLARPKGKVVVTWHSDIVKQKLILFFYKPLLYWFLKKTDIILTTSPNMIEHSLFLRKFKDKCKVVPLGINPGDYELDQSDMQDIAVQKQRQTKKQLLFVGRLIYYKGVEYLVDAMPNIDAELTIVGSGTLLEPLKAKIAELGQQSKIRIVNNATRKNLSKYFRLCDIFVLPSVATSEAFGIVQLEAMYCGKPVVSTNLPTGVPFVNQDNKTGFVVEPCDVAGLTRAVNKLITDDQLRQKLGTYAKKRVEKEFINSVVAERVKGVYEWLVVSG